MWARLSIVAGLVLGVVVAAALIWGILAYAPMAPPPTIAAPSLVVASATPSPAESTAPSTSPSATP
jgi:hypothetical protein